MTDQQKGDAAKAPAQDKPSSSGIPWIGSLMGGVPALDLPDEDETPAGTDPKAETPKAETPKAETPKAETPKGDKPGVTVNVFPGKKPKAKAKPAAKAEGEAAS